MVAGLELVVSRFPPDDPVLTEEDQQGKAGTDQEEPSLVGCEEGQGTLAQ
ncbi:MAG: hypothetical protein HW404_1358 [Anaerolineales bacterium]|nr:hypothetical protein [Anaerolineales bacterium]